MFRFLSIAFSMTLIACPYPAMAQAPAPPPAGSPGATPAQTPAGGGRAARPPVPARDPNTPGYVTAKELPDGANAPVKVDGNFILGPTHNPAPEMMVQEGVP